MVVVGELWYSSHVPDAMLLCNALDNTAGDKTPDGYVTVYCTFTPLCNNVLRAAVTVGIDTLPPLAARFSELATPRVIAV